LACVGCYDFHSGYYSELTLTPGVNFFRLFLDNAKSSRKMKLRLNIPLTVGILGDKFLLHTSNTSAYH